MEKYIYEDGDKICPIMSIRMLVWKGKFVACMGEKCMFFDKRWNKCRHD